MDSESQTSMWSTNNTKNIDALTKRKRQDQDQQDEKENAAGTSQ
jgi:hypothetical protein